MLQRERYLILGGLLVLAAFAWVFLIWQSSMRSNQAMGLTMGMSALLFIAIWIVMMVAMMFPTATPMILMFTKIYASKRQQSILLSRPGSSSAPICSSGPCAG